MKRCFGAIVLLALLVTLGPGNASADHARKYRPIGNTAAFISSASVAPNRQAQREDG